VKSLATSGSAGKREYVAPQLVLYGGLERLTQAIPKKEPGGFDGAYYEGVTVTWS
jgi:hypothetical protein